MEDSDACITARGVFRQQHTGQGMELQSVEQLMGALDEYRAARAAFLVRLGLPASNRDPLAEFSERLVAMLLSGRLPESRVQEGYDVLAGPSDARVQVRYLANPAGSWVNEHVIKMKKSLDYYALVIFEALQPVAVLVFPKETLAAVCEALGKRHPAQDTTLQFTQHNFTQIRGVRERYARHGVTVFVPPFTAVVRTTMERFVDDDQGYGE